MMHFRFWRKACLAIVALPLALLTGCVDEDTVFNDRPFSDDPPPEAGGFLGVHQGKINTRPGACRGGVWAGSHRTPE